LGKQRTLLTARSANEPHCGKNGPRGCAKILRLAADGVIHSKVVYYAKMMGVRPHSVRTTAARTRWGSCGAQNNLCFSWRLALVDDGLIDYVVVHELAHMKEMNHSAKFWAIVEKVIPDYRERRKKLKTYADR
jgi:predicted metal-dependent hydrolase